MYKRKIQKSYPPSDSVSAHIALVYQVQAKVKCMMPNGKVLSISRDQIPLVPNFAMTDYNSQGRTRANNVVDLNNCRN